MLTVFKRWSRRLDWAGWVSLFDGTALCFNRYSCIFARLLYLFHYQYRILVLEKRTI